MVACRVVCCTAAPCSIVLLPLFFAIPFLLFWSSHNEMKVEERREGEGERVCACVRVCVCVCVLLHKQNKKANFSLFFLPPHFPVWDNEANEMAKEVGSAAAVAGAGGGCCCCCDRREIGCHEADKAKHSDTWKQLE